MPDRANSKWCQKWGKYLLRVLSEKFNKDEMGYQLLTICCIRVDFKFKDTADGLMRKLKDLMQTMGFNAEFGQYGMECYYKRIEGPPPTDGAGDNNAGAIGCTRAANCERSAPLPCFRHTAGAALFDDAYLAELQTWGMGSSV